MDCVAESTIVAYLADKSHGGNNLKSVQEDGIAAGGVYHTPLGGGDLGSYGIRWWAQFSKSGSAVLPSGNGGTQISRVMGGFQSGGILTANATDIAEQGCNVPLADCGIIGTEQVLYNFLASFFDGTSVGSLRGPGHYGEYDGVTYAPNGIVSGNVPLNYLQIYAADVTYYSQLTCIREAGECPDNLVITGTGESVYTNGPWQLDLAAQELQQIADPPIVDFPL
jgi:hypothetical protein